MWKSRLLSWFLSMKFKWLWIDISTQLTKRHQFFCLVVCLTEPIKSRIKTIWKDRTRNHHSRIFPNQYFFVRKNTFGGVFFSFWKGNANNRSTNTFLSKLDFWIFKILSLAFGFFYLRYCHCSRHNTFNHPKDHYHHTTNLQLPNRFFWKSKTGLYQM